MKKLTALVRKLARESDVTALAVYDEHGRSLAGVGSRAALEGLGRIARAVAEDEPGAELDAITEGTDVMARSIDVGPRRVYLAALGRRVRKMVEASERIAAILAT